MPHRDEEARRKANRAAQERFREKKRRAALGAAVPAQAARTARPKPSAAPAPKLDGQGPVGEIVGILGQLPPGAWTEQKADMAAECIALARRIVQTYDPARGTPNDAVRLFQLGIAMFEAAKSEAMVRQAEGGPQDYPLVEAAFAAPGDEGRDLLVGLMMLAAKHGTQRRAG